MKRITTFLFITVISLIAVFPAAAQTVPADAFRQEGIASWYGVEFDGRPTASGEIFDSSRFTAAHPTLPMDTYLTVTNTQNNRKVTVRVNDRGPFVAARIIDVSRAAAEALDMIFTGTAPVIVERAINNIAGPVNSAELSGISPAPRATPVSPAAVRTAPVVPPLTAETISVFVEPVETTAVTAAPVVPAYIPAPPAEIKGVIPAAASTGLFRLQIGAYKNTLNVVNTINKLKNAGLNPAYEQDGEIYRVVLPGLNAADIPQIAQKLGDAGFREAIIRAEANQ